MFFFFVFFWSYHLWASLAHQHEACAHAHPQTQCLCKYENSSEVPQWVFLYWFLIGTYILHSCFKITICYIFYSLALIKRRLHSIYTFYFSYLRLLVFSPEISFRSLPGLLCDVAVSKKTLNIKEKQNKFPESIVDNFVCLNWGDILLT